MNELTDGLFVGGDRDCFHDERQGWAVVHACKSPCHQRAVGYRGSLPSKHPNYLTFRHDSHLYLNMIDPDLPLFMPPLFLESIEFIAEQLSQRKVIIHCNQGLSRAPSLAMLYLAGIGHIEGSDFERARADFRRIHPEYAPGPGIAAYLRAHWQEVMTVPRQH